MEECDTLESLRKWHWVDLFEEDGYENLMRALRARANKIDATLQINSVTRENNQRELAEKVERERGAKAGRENQELEAAERIAREKAEREAAEKAKREKAEREVAERIEREKAKKEGTEKARLRKSIDLLNKEAKFGKRVPELDEMMRDWSFDMESTKKKIADPWSGQAGLLGVGEDYLKYEEARLRKHDTSKIKADMTDNLEKNYPNSWKNLTPEEKQKETDKWIECWNTEVYRYTRGMSKEEWLQHLARQGVMYLRLAQEVYDDYDNFAKYYAEKNKLSKVPDVETFIKETQDPFIFYGRTVEPMVKFLQEKYLKEIQTSEPGSENFKTAQRKWLYFQDMTGSNFFERMGNDLPTLTQSAYKEGLPDDRVTYEDRKQGVINDFLRAFR